MPYYPQSPGFYPPLNSVTDGQLVDMPDGTVKGRALGAGLGDPQNLTPAQLWALLGNPVFTACRLDYVSTTIIRLSRWNGYLLTIDNAPQAIPAAGVDLAPTGLTVGIVYYIYAYMNAGVMTLIASGALPAVDARNGVQVMTGDATRTLVGMVSPDTGPVWVFTQQKYLVLSYFNRSPRHLRLDISAAGTASTAMVQLSGFVYFLHWGGLVAPQYLGGSVQNTAANAWHTTGIRLNAGGGFDFPTFLTFTGGVQNVSCGASFAVNPGASNLALWGSVASGNGSWTGIITMPLEV